MLEDSALTCQHCSGRSSTVIDSRVHEVLQRRRRRCRGCGRTWGTVEISQYAYEELLRSWEQAVRAEQALRQERRKRIGEIRFMIRTLGPYIRSDTRIQLAVEYLKTRAEFLMESLPKKEQTPVDAQ